MKIYVDITKYRTKKSLDKINCSGRDIKFDIFCSLNNLSTNQYYSIKKTWYFFVFMENYSKTKKFSGEKKKLNLIISNLKKTEFNSGNILAFPGLTTLYKNHKNRFSVNIFPKPLYINIQYDINRKMRAILVDWLIDVHCKFKLVPATLYLTINSIDRFLSLYPVVRQKLQLLGISSMLLASKYEEIYAPETRDFVYISDNAYSKDDIFKMEILICKTLEYIFHIPSPIFYIADWSKNLNASQDEIIFSIYIFELHLIEYDSLAFSTDIISIGSLLKSICLLNNLIEKFDPVDFFRKLNVASVNLVSLKDCLMLLNSLLILNQNGKKKSPL